MDETGKLTPQERNELYDKILESMRAKGELDDRWWEV